MSMTLDDIRQTFSKDLYATEATGAQILEAGEHFARCGVTLTPIHRNAMGAVMGGVLFTIADFAFAVAANSNGLEWVSLESSIHYLSSAPSQQIFASTKCIRQGRTTCLYEIELRNENDHLLAIVTTSGMRIVPQSPQKLDS